MVYYVRSFFYYVYIYFLSSFRILHESFVMKWYWIQHEEVGYCSRCCVGSRTEERVISQHSFSSAVGLGSGGWLVEAAMETRSGEVPVTGAFQGPSHFCLHPSDSFRVCAPHGVTFPADSLTLNADSLMNTWWILHCRWTQLRLLYPSAAFGLWLRFLSSFCMFLFC